MDALHFDSLILFHDPGLRLLYHRWQGEYNLHRFRAAASHVHQLLHQHAIESWVVDLNDLPNIGLEDQVWVSNDVLPKIARLIQVRQLALVLSPNVYNQLAAESILQFGQRYLKCDIQFFGDAPTALDWILSFNAGAHIPAWRELVA